jgi:hypothetical protein
MDQFPNNQFIGACLEFDQLLAHLQVMRADHFGADPERVTWGDVADVNHANELLRECVRFLSGSEEG